MPRISIILLTKNGRPTLERTLASIFAQRTDQSFEVLAIDSGSADGTLELLAQHPIRIVCIPPAEFNFGRTRGMGYDMAEGDILVNLSQDAVPADDHWLEKLTAPFRDPTIAAVAGAQALPKGDRYFYWERSGRFYQNRSRDKWRALYGFSFSNANSAIRKQVWQNNKYGSIETHEDRFMQKMWTERHFRIVRAANAKVLHAHKYDLRSLAMRSENDGLGQKLCGQQYSLTDAFLDMLRPELWQFWISGCLTREIRTPAEFLFPLVRPLFLWKGNKFAKEYAVRSL